MYISIGSCINTVVNGPSRMFAYVPESHGEQKNARKRYRFSLREMAEDKVLKKLLHRKESKHEKTTAELEKMLANYLPARINIQNI